MPVGAIWHACASTLASRGTLGRSKETAEHKKDSSRSMLGFLSISVGFGNSFFESFLVPLSKKGGFVHDCFRISFYDVFRV